MKKNPTYSFMARVLPKETCLSELIYLSADFGFSAAAMEPSGNYQFFTNSMKTALTAMSCLRQLKDINAIELFRNVPDLEDPEGNWELIAEYSSRNYQKACDAVAKAAAEAKLEELKAKLNDTRKKSKKHRCND